MSRPNRFHIIDILLKIQDKTYFKTSNAQKNNTNIVKKEHLHNIICVSKI